MFRAFLIAVGVSMCLVGAECLVVDQAVFKYPRRTKGAVPAATTAPRDPFSQQRIPIFEADEPGTARHTFKPPEWAPWSLLSGGVVIALYALTVQRD